MLGPLPGKKGWQLSMFGNKSLNEITGNHWKDQHKNDMNKMNLVKHKEKKPPHTLPIRLQNNPAENLNISKQPVDVGGQDSYCSAFKSDCQSPRTLTIAASKAFLGRKFDIFCWATDDRRDRSRQKL